MTNFKLSPSQQSSLIKKANQYRIEELHGKAYSDTGFIVFCRRLKAFAWIRDLNNPQRFEPLVIALDCNNNFYIATGGNDYDGAKEWKLLTRYKTCTQKRMKKLTST